MTRKSQTLTGKERPKAGTQSQFDKFKKLAEESGCEDNHAAFDQTLKRLADTPPPETVEKRKAKKS